MFWRVIKTLVYISIIVRVPLVLFGYQTLEPGFDDVTFKVCVSILVLTVGGEIIVELWTEGRR